MSCVQIRLDQNHMATTFEFRVSCDPARGLAAERAMSDAHRVVALLEGELSEFRESSPVYKLNHAEALVAVPITESVKELWDLAVREKARTKGAFNPLCKSKNKSGEIRLSADGKGLFKTERDTHLSFGAIGKGFALDRARLVLEREGFTDYLLTAGGSSVLISGFAAPRTPWSWAWSWKKDVLNADVYRGKKFVHASGKAIALGVSGTMEQGEHILSNGERLNSLSALVAHSSAARADALSTALFVSGWKDISALQDPLQIMPLAWMDKEENIQWNGDFQNLWGSPCS
ncbi:MAG: FAD:protein FMN transferase [Bdellovibrionota bacterium]